MAACDSIHVPTAELSTASAAKAEFRPPGSHVSVRCRRPHQRGASRLPCSRMIDQAEKLRHLRSCSWARLQVRWPSSVDVNKDRGLVCP